MEKAASNFWLCYDPGQAAMVQASFPVEADPANNALAELMEGESAERLAGFVATAHLLLANAPPNLRGEWAGRQRELTERRQQLDGNLRDLEASLAFRRWVGPAWLPWNWSRFRRTYRRDSASGIAGKRQAVASLSEAVRQAEQASADAQRRQTERAGWERDHATELIQGTIAAMELDYRAANELDQLADQPPAYLVRQLGPPPVDPIGRQLWCRGARIVETFRAEHSVADLDHALGKAPPPGDWRRHAHDQAVASLQDLQPRLSAARYHAPGSTLLPDIPDSSGNPGVLLPQRPRELPHLRLLQPPSTPAGDRFPPAASPAPAPSAAADPSGPADHAGVRFLAEIVEGAFDPEGLDFLERRLDRMDQAADLETQRQAARTRAALDEFRSTLQHPTQPGTGGSEPMATRTRIASLAYLLHKLIGPNALDAFLRGLDSAAHPVSRLSGAEQARRAQWAQWIREDLALLASVDGSRQLHHPTYHDKGHQFPDPDTDPDHDFDPGA